MRSFPGRTILTILVSLFIAVPWSYAQTTAFSYQGRLTEGGNPASGSFQMQFKLFDSIGGSGQVGSTLTDIAVTVTDGIFSVKLDFGANALSGANRWLEIAVRRNSGESYTTLSPREQIASSPYAVRTLSAASADNALNLGGVPASEYVTTSTVGSSFIRNGATLQTASFNISGNGYFGGSVGIGTTAPLAGYGLDAFGNIRSFSGGSTHLVAQTTGGTNSWARFYLISPNRTWFIGTSQNFNGDQFYLNDDQGGQSRMTIQPNGGPIAFPFGNVGIGTTSPATRLTLTGGPTWTANGWAASLNLQNSSALGWEANASGQRFGIGQSTDGLYFFRTNSGFGNTASPANYDLVIRNSGNIGIGTADPQSKLTIVGTGGDGFSLATSGNVGFGGNAIQGRDRGGLVKAMIYVEWDATIIRCYNGITGSSTGNCGFSVNRFTSGGYGVNFGFQVNDRFVSVTPRFFNGSVQSVAFFPASLTTIDVRTSSDSDHGDTEDAPFIIIVY